MKIALLTGAKDQSYRLPGKNYKKLLGKELCRYTFEFVSRLPYQYYLFTDSDRLIEIAKEYKINIIKSDMIGKGILENRMVHEIIKADKYFCFSITSPIRDMKNIQKNISLCLLNDFDSAYSVSLKNLLEPRPTGSMFYWSSKQLEKLDIRDENSICLPDKYDFDIDEIEEFNRVKTFLKRKHG